MAKYHRWSLFPALLGLALGCVAMLPSAASAGSGDFCKGCELANGKYAFGSVRPHWLEVESWNTNGKGQASCAGVGYGPEKPEFEADRCSAKEEKEGYNEAYCIARCEGQVYLIAMLVDNSGFASSFSGWEDWSETDSPAIQNTQSDVAPPLSGGTAEIASVPTRAADAFGVFTRQHVAADFIPSEAQGVFSQASGANTALAHRVTGSEGTESWIIPGDGTVCIQSRSVSLEMDGANCSSTSAAEAGELGGSSASRQHPGVELVSGVMPDGVSAVTLHLIDGEAITVPVRENVYQAVVHGAVVETTAVSPSSLLAVKNVPASSAAARLLAQ